MRESQFQPSRPWELVVLRGTDSAAARARAQTLLSSIGPEGARLFDLAARADRMGRGEPVQLALVVSSVEECARKLQGICDGEAHDSDVVARSAPVGGKVAFLFSGVRGELPQIAADLCAHFPQLRNTLPAEPAMASWVLSAAGREDTVPGCEELSPSDPRVAQPALAIIAVALTRLLQELGVIPEAAAGFCSGELSALWLGGALPEWELVRLSRVRAETSLSVLQDADVSAGSRFEAALQGVAMSAPLLPVWSNVTAQRYPKDASVVAALLSRQLHSPVRFEEQIRDMYREGVRVFVAIGPDAALTEKIRGVLGVATHLAVAIAADRAHGVRSLLTALATLLVAGVPVATEALFADRRVQRIESDDHTKGTDVMTLIDMLSPLPGQALDTPWLSFRNKSNERVLNRAEFIRSVRAIASELMQRASAGDRILLVFPPGPDFLCAFAAVVYAGMIAVPVYPPDGRPQSIPRFLALVADSKPALVLGTAEVCSQAAFVPELSQLPWLATDTVDPVQAQHYRQPDLDPDSIAFIQYTSGSTGMPRGVVHTHRNVLANMDLIARTMNVGPGLRSVMWLPLYHDMGLITALLSVRNAATLTLISPLTFLRDPIEWLRNISRDGATHSGGPNFAYDLCVKKVKPEDIATLDLSSWSQAYNGAEPIRAETLDRFAETFAPCGFRREAFLPCYGLAEATLLVSVGPAGAAPTSRSVEAAAISLGRAVDVPHGAGARTLIASGKVHDDAEVAIVDPQTLQRCEGNQIGEIWVRGPGIGKGYWGKGEESERTFRACIEPSGEGPYLRTGDLGFVRDAQLYVTGRLKDLIVIRGQNYYPQDIESVVASAHPAVRPDCCIAVALTDQANEELAIFFELNAAYAQGVVLSDVLTKVREAVSESCALSPQVVAVVKKGSLVKTSSGKPRRAPSREAFLAGSLPLLALYDARAPQAESSTAAANDVVRESELSDEEKKATLIGAVQTRLLKEIRLVVKEPISEESVVTRLGINSVSAIEIMFAIEEEFKMAIPPTLLAESITIRELATRIASGEAARERAVCTSQAIAPSRTRAAKRAIDFSLMYFSTDTQPTQTRYDIFLRSAKFADEHGFRALWVPERHFHAFGGTYANPSVAAAALAVLTKRVRIRAGSVVLPLHHPIRVAEDWSMVDNLSGGRVDLAFATGWNPNDFVIAPDKFEGRRAVTLDGLEQVRRLWAGEKLRLPNGRGETTAIEIHPKPIQRELAPWLTCTTHADGFVQAGERGYNVLTALLFQRVDELASKIELYRQARARHGHDPDAGVVTLMLHTFVGSSMAGVRRKVSEPFKRYLASSIDLWKHEWADLVPENGTVSKEMLDVAFERYANGNALFGTPASCADLVSELHGVGVDEIACLIDFGVAADDVIDSLVYLDDLRARATDQTETSVPHDQLTA